VPDFDDKEEFAIMVHCMRNVNFSNSEIEEVMDQVVAILNLGNVDFTDTGDAVSPTLETKDYLITSAKYL
jgi:myosin heavy subunit